MKRRIFIAINLPEKIKKELFSFQEEIGGVFGEKKDIIRWTKPENLHITLIFLGYISDEELVEVCNIAKKVAENCSPFSINLNRICYGPPKKMPPRMVWVEGEKSAEFTALRDDLEKTLMTSEGVRFSPEERVFSPYSETSSLTGRLGHKAENRPHITLGRIKTWQWRQIEPEEKPEISKEIDFVFPVNSVEIMESQLKRGGPEYTILESLPFLEG